MQYNITDVEIAFINPKDGLIGFASLNFNDAFRLGSIGIYTKLDGGGYRLAWPTIPGGPRGRNLFYPINNPCRLAIEKAVFSKLDESGGLYGVKRGLVYE